MNRSGSIKTTAEHILERMYEWSEALVPKFMKSVRPIFGYEHNKDHPIHVGSCILLQVGNLKYVVTAAHVLDNHKRATLQVSTDQEQWVMDGDFYGTRTDTGRRADDRYDFAYKRLTEADMASFKNCVFLEEYSRNQIDPKSRVYTLLGFPNSKNKPKKLTREIQPVAYPVMGLAEMSPSHVKFIHKPNNLGDKDRQRVNAIPFRGMSGGALIDFGSFSDPSKLVEEPTGTIAGIIVEHPDNESSVLCTKIDIVIADILRRNPPNEGQSERS